MSLTKKKRNEGLVSYDELDSFRIAKRNKELIKYIEFQNYKYEKLAGMEKT